MSSEWAGHIPLAMVLIDLLRPRVVVELGTFNGVSYCAFCQAVKELGLDTRGYAIGTWRDDEGSGFFGEEIFRDLSQHHDPLYAGWSTLIQSSFDGALDRFTEGAIDLLHINSRHSYDVVRHNFESWLPKMSARGVILLSATNGGEPESGVARLWEEIKPKFPHFEFVHERGLGVIAAGSNIPARLGALIAASPAEAQTVRDFFAHMGQRLRLRIENAQQENVINRLTGEAAARETQLENRDAALAEREATVMALTDELSTRDARINAILTCRAWRWSQRMSRVKQVLASPFSGVLDRFHANGKNDSAESRAQTPAVPALRPPALGPEHALVLSSPAALREAARSESQARDHLRPDVVCFSIVDWSFRYQRPQQIMSQFAANGHRVFVIRLDQTLPAQARPRFSVLPLKENLYQITLAALRPVMINQEEVKGGNAASICETLDELRTAYGISEAIAYVMTPSWTTMAQEVKRRWGWRVVYDCMDDWNGFPGFGMLAALAEDRLVNSCDLLVVTAHRLKEKWHKHSRLTLLAPNAADFDFYQERCQPNKMLVNTDHPIVGYFGAIADWFDLDLMVEVARRRPGYTFVLLGGVFEVDVTELRSLPNVRILGQQPYETMPQYLYHFDACVIPFKLNRTTLATDPVKVYEYLSGGKPVVSVNLPELNSCRELLYIARDTNHFVEQLDQAVAENDEAVRNRRRRFAAENTWHKRYEAIVAALSDATPPASIVIVTYNGLALSKLCLESVIRNTDYPNYEIIVVDNCSEDGTPAYLQQLSRQYRHVKIILNSDNRGFPRAVNQGIEASAGERLVILNNDTIVSRGWLGRLLRHLDNPEIGLVGPVTNFAGNEAKIPVEYRTLGQMEAFADEWMRTHDRQVADIHMLAMFCLALRRETHKLIGPLDEQFGLGMFEDDDYCMRARSAALRVVCAADVFIHHFGQAAFKKLIDNGEYEKIFNENRRRYESKWNVTWIAHKNAPLPFAPIVNRVAEL